MLKFIRKNAGGYWVKVIFGTIVLVFIFWGVGGGLDGGKKQEWVAHVNGDTIESADLVRAHDNLLRMYQNIYKDQFKPELAKMLDLKGKAVDQLVRVSLLRQEAERLQLRASDLEIRSAIGEMKAFQTEDGRFDKELYIRVLRANRLMPGDFETSQREEILVNKLQDVIVSGVHVTETEALEHYHFENDKITLKFIKFDPSTFAADVKLADDEAQKYYDANQEQFRDPEKVRIEYVQYTADKFADKVVIADADLQQYYDIHKAEYEKPEQAQARHILLKVDSGASDEKKAEVRKKAEELLAKAKGGEDFAALATANSEDEGSAPKGGDLGSFGRGAMVKPFEETAFGLEPGEISDIVETQFGLHIIKLEGKTPAQTQTLDEARGAITEKVKAEKSRELAQAQANADQGKVDSGAPLATIAEAAGLKVSTPEPFAQSETPAGIGRGPLLNASFATAAGKVGPVVDTPSGFYVFIVKEKIETRVPPLAEIKERVEKVVREKRGEEVAKSKADAALIELQNSKDIDAVAKSLQLTADETPDFPRQGGYISKIGTAPDLKKVAFTLTPEQPVAPAVYAVSGSSVIAILKERNIADDEKFKTEKDTVIKQVEDRRKGQAMEDFVNYLKAQAKVELNQEYIAAIADSGRPMGR